MSERIKEVILCKYGEVVLKGANRSDFEAKMIKDLRTNMETSNVDDFLSGNIQEFIIANLKR